MIQINNLNFSYRKSSHKVLSDFNLTFNEGHIYGLLGANGVGKSTLLYNIAGILQAKQAAITINGIDVRKRYPNILSECMLIAEEFIVPEYTLNKYVKLHSPFYSKFDRSAMNKYLAVFDLPDNPTLSNLSMGQKKKVMLSFAMACNTDILLLDEPTNGLDIPSKSQFRKFINMGMREDKIIIISTHQVSDIENILDDVIIMNNNGVIFNHSIAETENVLYFGENDSNAIYSQPSPGGHYTVSPNIDGLDSAVNLELLFNAVLTNKDAIEAQFNKQF